MAGDIRHSNINDRRPSRLNRDDPRRGAGPFANQIKAGRVEQDTPNGCAYDNDYPEPAMPAIIGGEQGPFPGPRPWKGNRSGE